MDTRNVVKYEQFLNALRVIRDYVDIQHQGGIADLVELVETTESRLIGIINTKVDVDDDKVLSDLNFSAEDKAIIDRLNALNIDNTYQKINDARLATDAKTIVGAINELRRQISTAINAGAKIDAMDSRVNNLEIKANNHEDRLEDIEKLNLDERINYVNNQFADQNLRLTAVEKQNKIQDVYIRGLFNETADQRLHVDGSNYTDLPGSVSGILDVKSIEGNTMYNLSETKEEKAVTHKYNDTNAFDIPLTDSKDGEQVQIESIEGNTMVNFSKIKEDTAITYKFDDVIGNSDVLEGSSGKVRMESIEGNTMVNRSKTKDDVWLTHKFDDQSGNVFKLEDAEAGAIDIESIEGNTMVNRSKTKDSTPATKIYNDLNVPTQIYDDADEGNFIEIDTIEGNTMVNRSKTKDATEVSYAYDDSVNQNEIILDNAATEYVNPEITGQTLVNLSDLGDETPISHAYGEVNGRYVELTNADGHVNIGQITGETAINVSEQKDPLVLTSYNDGGAGRVIPAVEDVDCDIRPVIEGNTLVNVVTEEFHRESVTPSVQPTDLNFIATPSDANEIKPALTGNTLVNRNAEWDAVIPNTSADFSTSGIEVDLTGNIGSEFSIDVEGHTAHNLSGIQDTTLSQAMNGTTNKNYANFSNTNNDVIVRPIVEGNTLVNHNAEYDKSMTIGTAISGSGNTIELGNSGTVGSSVEVSIDGHTANNVANRKGGKLSKSFDSKSGNFVDFSITKDSSVDIEVEGNTLVNIHPKNTPTLAKQSEDTGNYTVDSRENYIKITCSDATIGTWRYVHFGDLKFDMFKPNTKYTIVFTKLKGITHICLQEGTGTLRMIDGISTNEGQLIYTLTTKPELTKGSQILYLVVSSGKSTVDVEVENPMIFEGDITANPPAGYIEGLKSCFEEHLVTDESDVNHGKYKAEIVSCGKNLFDASKSVLVNSYLYSYSWGFENDIPYPSNTKSDGRPWSYGYCQYYKELSAGTYTIKLETILPSENPNSQLAVFNSQYKELLVLNFQEIKVIGSHVKSFTLTQNDIVGIEFKMYEGKYKIQLEKGSTVTAYEPYKEQRKTIYLNSPLLKGDKLVTKDGKIYHYHKMGRVVLNGSENWSIDYTTDNSTHLAFATAINDIIHVSSQWDKPVKSDKFISDCWYYMYHTDFEKEIISSSYDNKNRIYIKIASSRLSSLDNAGIKSWLSNNPVKVEYQLAEPYYELIDDTTDMVIDIPSISRIYTPTIVAPSNKIFKGYQDEMTILEPSTTYTVAFDSDVAGQGMTITLGGQSVQITSALSNSLTITTPSTLTDKLLIIDGYGQVNIDNVRVTKGNNDYDEWFAGMKSGFEENVDENGKYEVEISMNYCPIEFGKGGRIE